METDESQCLIQGMLQVSSSVHTCLISSSATIVHSRLEQNPDWQITHVISLSFIQVIIIHYSWRRFTWIPEEVLRMRAEASSTMSSCSWFDALWVNTWFLYANIYSPSLLPLPFIETQIVFFATPSISICGSYSMCVASCTLSARVDDILNFYTAQVNLTLFIGDSKKKKKKA